MTYVKLISCRAPYAGLRWHILDEMRTDKHFRCRCGRKGARRDATFADEPTDDNLTCLGCLRMNRDRRYHRERAP